MASTIRPDHAVEGLMREQHGLVSREQVLDAGCTLNQIQYRLDQGIWLPADRGVYRHHLIPSSWNSDLLAPCLARGAIASHRSAGVLWELDGVRRTRPEVTVPAHLSARPQPGVRVHESTTFEMCDPQIISGIPVTGIYRTLIDLAKVVPYSTVRAATDDARLRELVTWEGMADAFFGHARRGRDGTALMRLYLDEHLGEAALPLSTWSRLVAGLLVDAGLPEPEFEFPVKGPGYSYKIDLAYPDLLLGLELDSVTFHLNRRSFEEDRRRSNHLQNLGWAMRHFSWADYSQQPQSMVLTVKNARKLLLPKTAKFRPQT